MSSYDMFKVRPLQTGWAVYFDGEPITDSMTRHNANDIWRALIKKPLAVIGIVLKAA